MLWESLSARNVCDFILELKDTFEFLRLNPHVQKWELRAVSDVTGGTQATGFKGPSFAPAGQTML